MEKPVLIDDAEIRSILRPFSDLAGMEVRPSALTAPDILVKVLESNHELQSIRNDIANAKVDIARARRPGSSTRASLSSLEERLRRLMADRQRVIALEAEGRRFQEAVAAEEGNAASALAEWQTSQDIAARIRLVLERERVPSVLRPKPLSIISVLEAVESHVEAAPQPGSLILMGTEPRPSGPDFRPVDASASGLNRRMFTAAVRLTTPPAGDRGAEALVDGAVESRNALMMPLSERRKPTDERHWRIFDDILPLATRREMTPLIPSCVPHSSPFSHLHRLLSMESWRAIRDDATRRSNGTCVVCGGSAGGEVRASWEYHEPLRASSVYGIQRLSAVNSYCASCIAVVFPAPADLVVPAPDLEGYRRGQNAYVVNPRMQRLSRLNRWDEEASPSPLAQAVSVAQAAYQRRSRVRWALDLAILHGRNVVLNPDMAMHRKGWIMRVEDVQAFDDHRSVHLTRIFNASFATRTGQLHFFDLPPIHEMPWNTSIDPFELRTRTPVDLREEAVVPDYDERDEPAGPEDPDSEDYVVEEGPPLGFAG